MMDRSYYNRWLIRLAYYSSSLCRYYGDQYGHGLNAYRINSYTVLMPLVKEAGIDPVYFGIMLLSTVQYH